jgi:hypothetical protein
MFGDAQGFDFEWGEVERKRPGKTDKRTNQI